MKQHPLFSRLSPLKTLFIISATTFLLLSNLNLALAENAISETNNTETATTTTLEAAPYWNDLTVAQRTALKPMQADWPHLNASRKQNWLAVAQRYQNMTPIAQARMHSRMSEWAKLSPSQRNQARDNYSAVLSSPASATLNGKSNLHEQWTKYQNLSPEQKAKLLEKSQANTASTTNSISTSTSKP